MLGGLAFSAAIAVLLIAFSYPLLRLLQVPEDIIHSAVMYLRIVFVGLIFTFIYNFFPIHCGPWATVKCRCIF